MELTEGGNGFGRSRKAPAARSCPRAAMILTNIVHGIYVLFLVLSSVVLISKSLRFASSHFKNIFWSLAVFAIMKALSALALYAGGASGLPGDVAELIGKSRSLFAVVANIFLFHFGISILTYKVETWIDYKIFPLLLLIGFMVLFISGAVETSDLETTSRFSFGYNGSILGFVGCLNLYFDRKKRGGRRRILYGLLLLGAGLLAYAITEGVVSSSSIQGMSSGLLDVITAGMLATASLLANDLMKREVSGKIGYI